jgi:hypothetical protein
MNFNALCTSLESVVVYVFVHGMIFMSPRDDMIYVIVDLLHDSID